MFLSAFSCQKSYNDAVLVFICLQTPQIEAIIIQKVDKIGLSNGPQNIGIRITMQQNVLIRI